MAKKRKAFISPISRGKNEINKGALVHVDAFGNQSDPQLRLVPNNNNQVAEYKQSNSTDFLVAAGVAVSKQIWNYLTDDQRAMVRDVSVNQGKEAASNLVRAFSAGFRRNRRRPGGGGSNNNNNNNGGDSMSGRRRRGNGSGGSSEGGGSSFLSNNPKPSSIGLNSGIRPNFYSRDFMRPDGICSPMHMSMARFKFPTQTADYLYKYFTDLIAFDIQSKAQANVSFNLNVTGVFTAANILGAMNALANALQVYYYYASVIGYHSHPGNKNAGMLCIHKNITAQNIQDLNRLARRLMDTPTPPNLMETIRYLSGNYYSGTHNGSTLLKIAPLVVNEFGVAYLDSINDAFDELDSNINNEIFSLLRRAVPSWLPGTLRDVPVEPLYDDDFITIMANLPFSYASSNGTVFNPVVSSEDEEITYNCFSDNLDGVAFALQGLILSDVNHGLMEALNLFDSNVPAYLDTRLSYALEGDQEQFHSSRANVIYSHSRAVTYFPPSTAPGLEPSKAHLSGASYCRGVSINSISEAAVRSLDWLMSLDTIKRGNSTNNRIKGRYN